MPDGNMAVMDMGEDECFLLISHSWGDWHPIRTDRGPVSSPIRNAGAGGGGRFDVSMILLDNLVVMTAW